MKIAVAYFDKITTISLAFTAFTMYIHFVPYLTINLCLELIVTIKIS